MCVFNRLNWGLGEFVGIVLILVWDLISALLLYLFIWWLALCWWSCLAGLSVDYAA